MKHILTSAAVAAALLASPAAYGKQRDPFVGEFAGENCAKGTQCWLEIEKAGKTYKLKFVVADRMDASKVLCQVPFKLKRGPYEYSQHLKYKDVLHGYLNDSPTYVTSFDGGVNLEGGLSAGDACGKYFMFGSFNAFGDE